MSKNLLRSLALMVAIEIRYFKNYWQLKVVFPLNSKTQDYGKAKTVR